MALNADPAAIRRFVLDALRLGGAAFSEADGELVLATCQVTVPGGIFAGPRDGACHEYLRRRAELIEKLSPAVRISLTNVALLYLPAVVFAVEGHDGRPLPPTRYEPAAGKLWWEGVKT